MLRLCSVWNTRINILRDSRGFRSLNENVIKKVAVKFPSSRHESIQRSRNINPPTLNLGTKWSGHLHAPAALPPYPPNRGLGGSQSQSGRCGSRHSNSACRTRSPVTTPAELHKLIKRPENEPGNLTNLLTVPYQAFLFT
jgi:hypothetical protein